MICLSRMSFALGMMTQHQDPSGCSLSSLHQASVPSLSSSISSPLCPTFGRDLHLWLSPLVINLVILHSAVKLKHHRARAESLGGGAVVSPQAAATQSGMVCLSRIAAAIMGITQLWVPFSYSLSKASVPSLSSGISSPFCYCLCQNPR